MFNIEGKINTAICYAKVVEDEAIEQIRRMCEEVGLEVIRLKRTEIAGVKLGMLPQGKWRPLNEREMRHLTNVNTERQG